MTDLDVATATEVYFRTQVWSAKLELQFWEGCLQRYLSDRQMEAEIFDEPDNAEIPNDPN